MSLTEQLFSTSAKVSDENVASSSKEALEKKQKKPNKRDGDASSVTVTAAPAFDFAPVKKANIDLFARAPQVKKLTRKEKQRMRREAEMREAAAKKGKKKDGDEGTSTKQSSGNLFEEVFATDEVEKELAAEEALKKRKTKKQILRHALHKNEEEDVRTVFVGNLPNTIQKRDVEKIFKDCGAIESVRVRCLALEVPDEKSKNAGRAVRVLRGEIKKDDKYSATAYVLFRSVESIPTALQKNGVVFKDRHVVVTTLDAESVAYPPETSIFIGNIAYDATEEQVWNFFVENGITDVKRVRLIRDRDSGDCKGFGYVEFISRSSVAPAIETRGSKLNGREIRIVHVNKSKEVKAGTASRREKRRTVANVDGGKDRKRQRDSRGEHHHQGGDARKRARQESSGGGGGDGTPSWMGVTTNPRKKMPRDLRGLVEGKRDKPTGPRAPVKRKMRNPEK